MHVADHQLYPTFYIVLHTLRWGHQIQCTDITHRVGVTGPTLTGTTK